MPRKFFRRFTPHPDRVRGRRSLRALGKLLHQPSLWHFNRHSASRGMAVGLFWGFIPVPGQTIFAAITAIKLRANVALAVVMPWVATFVLFPGFYAAYRLGLLILRQPPMENFFDNFHISFSWMWSHRDALLPFLVGSLPVAVAMAVAGYFLIQGIWRWNLLRRWRKRTQRLQREAAIRSRARVHV